MKQAKTLLQHTMLAQLKAAREETKAVQVAHLMCNCAQYSLPTD